MNRAAQVPSSLDAVPILSSGRGRAVWPGPGVRRLPRFLGGLIVLTASLIAGAAYGHTHVEVQFTVGHWTLDLYDFDGGHFDPAAFPVRLDWAARRAIPLALAPILGPAGGDVWILPQNEDPNLPFLGIGAESIRAGDVQPGSLDLSLRAVEGPGDFVVFLTGPLGTPKLLFSSRDGLPDNLPLNAGPGSHLHCNWAFTAPGTYRVTFRAHARLPDGTPTESADTPFLFQVIAPPATVLTITPASRASVTISFGTEAGVVYQLQRRTALTAGAWENHGQSFMGTGRDKQLSVPAGEAAGFLRLTSGN